MNYDVTTIFMFIVFIVSVCAVYISPFIFIISVLSPMFGVVTSGCIVASIVNFIIGVIGIIICFIWAND